MSDSSFCGNEKVVILCNTTIHMQWKELFMFFQKLSWDLKDYGLPLLLTLVQQPSSYLLLFLKAPFLFITGICGAVWSLRKLSKEFSFFILSNNSVCSSHWKWFFWSHLAMTHLDGSKYVCTNCIFLINDHTQNI